MNNIFNQLRRFLPEVVDNDSILESLKVLSRPRCLGGTGVYEKYFDSERISPDKRILLIAYNVINTITYRYWYTNIETDSNDLCISYTTSQRINSLLGFWPKSSIKVKKGYDVDNNSVKMAMKTRKGYVEKEGIIKDLIKNLGDPSPILSSQI